MADNNPFIRDLLRQKSLVGSGIAVRGEGMLDYAVNLQSGYVSDVVKDVGDMPEPTGWSGTYYFALDVPVGRWRQLKFRIDGPASQTVKIGPPSQTPPPSNVLVSVSTTSVSDGYGYYIHTAALPFVLDADEGQWWAYLPQLSYPNNPSSGLAHHAWVSNAWTNGSGLHGSWIGADAEAWTGYDQFSICLLANLDNSPADGVLLALSDASDNKARVYVNSDKKVEGKFKNANGDVYALTTPRPLHPGCNLITLSYDKGVAVKLGINGVVVGTATPTNYGLFNSTLALGIGAQMLTGKTTSGQLKNALVDDVFVAKGVVSDADLWDIYVAYLTAAPLMQVEGAEKVKLS